MRKEQTFRYEEKSKVEQPKVDIFSEDFIVSFGEAFGCMAIGSILLLGLGKYISLWWTDRSRFVAYSIFLLLFIVIPAVIAYTSGVREAYKKQLKNKED